MLEGVLGHRYPSPVVEERSELVCVSTEDELPPAELVQLTPEVGLELVALVYPKHIRGGGAVQDMPPNPMIRCAPSSPTAGRVRLRHDGNTLAQRAQ